MGESDMKKLLSLVVMCGLLAFALQANALSITPNSNSLKLSGAGVVDAQGHPLTGTSAILTYIENHYTGFNRNMELFKWDAGQNGTPPTQSGGLKDSYNASFNFDLSGGTISLSSSALSVFDSSQPIYMIVKDGNNSPFWYFFDLTNLWNGIDDLVLSGFWNDNGSISHVSLYGTSAPVPEPATMLLLGSGIVGLVGFRKKFKA
jgi:hypothetical protein